LGSDLAFGPKGKVRFKAVLGIIISRLLLLPAVSLPLDTLLKLIGALPKDSTDLSFVLLIQSAMPSAMSLGILAQLQGHGGQEVGSILFYQYLMSFVTVTAWVSIFLAWL
jgi:predicted permease